MKKQLFVLIIGSLLCALHVGAQAVSAESAQAVATHFFNTRSTQPIAQLRQVPTASSNNEKTYYIFEPTVGNGFVMVSSERSLSPVLAYSMTQKFNLEGAPENLKSWLGNYTQQIQFAAENRLRPSRERNEQWTNLLAGTQAELRSTPVGPLLTTRWGQSPLYNQLCPRATNGNQAVTGCVATAMAQIMKYWNYPLVGRGGVAVADDTDASDGISGVFSANIEGTLYGWNNMPDVINAGQWASIAQLMRDAGISVNMNYGTAESGAYSANVPAAMHNYFGYSQSPLLSRNSYQKEEWEDMLRHALDNGIPVYYAGRKLSAAGKIEGSHAWVCDGYDGNYFHMNWGWDGSFQDDVWFAIDDLKPNDNQNYNYDQRAILGLVPLECIPNHTSYGTVVRNVQVADWIEAKSTIYAQRNLNIVFAAGSTIALLPGFSAPEGSSFNAWIEGCGGNNLLGNDALGSTEASPEASLPAETASSAQTGKTTLKVMPNPFAESTRVTYNLESEQLVSAQLLDMTGRLMTNPLSQQSQVAGEHQFTMNSDQLPAGLYFLVLQTGAKRQTQRVVITK